MIDIRNVTKLFGDFKVLDQLTLHVPRSAVYGLVGPNGAGKTTLLRHLTGVLRADSGDMLIDGQPVYENPAVKSRVAIIPDELYFFPQAGILEMKNVYKALYPSFDEQRFQELGKSFDLNPKKPIRRFSKGMQKQAFFWLTLSLRPDIVILDEPVDGLDPVMRRQVWSILVGDVAERGTTVLVSSHNLRELEDVCDHVGIMHKGKMLLERSLSELQDGAVKVQVVFEGDAPAWPDSIHVLHASRIGRVHTVIVRGSQEEVQRQMQHLGTVFVETIPLTLEEVFLYELGGVDYGVL